MQNLLKFRSFKSLVPRSVLEKPNNLKFAAVTSPSADFFTTESNKIPNLPVYALASISYDLTRNLERFAKMNHIKDSFFSSVLQNKIKNSQELLEEYTASIRSFAKYKTPVFPVKTAVEILYVEFKAGNDISEAFGNFKSLIQSKFEHLSLQSCVDLLEALSSNKNLKENEFISKLIGAINSKIDHLEVQNVEFDAWTVDTYNYSNKKNLLSFEEFEKNHKKSFVAAKLKFIAKYYSQASLSKANNFFFKNWKFIEFEEFAEVRPEEIQQQLETVQENLKNNFPSIKNNLKLQ